LAIPGWLTVISWVFIGTGLLSAALILADIYLLGYREHMKIMEAVWPLTALYAGPIAVAGYIRWGRPMSVKWMKARSHGMRGKPFWAGTVVSATHCGAGCVLGDLIAEWVIFAAGLQLAGFALPVEYPFDYVLALSWGILFQYFVIAPTRRLASVRGSSSRPKRTSWRYPPLRSDCSAGWRSCSSSCSPRLISPPTVPRSGS
jgi:hypothetical protein